MTAGIRFVDPRNDVAFKKILGDEYRKGVLISFLTSLLDPSGTKIEFVDVRLLNRFKTPRLERLKQTIPDIRALDARGVHYIIEMERGDPCPVDEDAAKRGVARGSETSSGNGPGRGRDTHYPDQSTTARPGTRANSRVLFVTSVVSVAKAWAAMRQSNGPMGIPLAWR